MGEDQTGAVTKFFSQLPPVHRFERVAPGHVRPALDSFSSLELDPDTGAHLIITEGLELLIYVKRYPLHELHDFGIPHFSIRKLGDSRLAFQNSYRHAERDAEFTLQRGLGHWIDQGVRDVRVGPDLDGFDIAAVKVMHLNQIQNKILGGMGERAGRIRLDRDPRFLHEVRMAQAADDFGLVVATGHGIEKASLGFQDIYSGGESLLG